MLVESVPSFVSSIAVNGHINMTVAEIIEATGCKSAGAVHRALKLAGLTYNSAQRGRKPADSDGEKPAPSQARRTKGFLPARTAGWVAVSLGGDADDDLPDDFDSEDFLALPDFAEDTARWRRHLGKLGTEEKTALTAWLGCGLTADERAIEAVHAASKARIAVYTGNDAALEKGRATFEQSRFDAPIVDFYRLAD